MTTNFLKSKLEKMNVKYAEDSTKLFFELNGCNLEAFKQDDYILFFFAKKWGMFFEKFNQILRYTEIK
jgi:hypothetical protein